jgi:hypothetical protein
MVWLPQCDADASAGSRPRGPGGSGRFARLRSARQRRSVGRAASPDGARCDADSGVLFRSAGEVMPDGIGLVGVRGGMCAPDPVADPEPEAEAGGEDGPLPVPLEPSGCGCLMEAPGLVP